MEKKFASVPNTLLCLPLVLRTRGTSPTPLASSARPRKYWSPSGAVPASLFPADFVCAALPVANTDEANPFPHVLARRFCPIRLLASARPVVGPRLEGSPQAPRLQAGPSESAYVPPKLNLGGYFQATLTKPSRHLYRGAV